MEHALIQVLILSTAARAEMYVLQARTALMAIAPARHISLPVMERVQILIMILKTVAGAEMSVRGEANVKMDFARPR